MELYKPRLPTYKVHPSMRRSVGPILANSKLKSRYARFAEPQAGLFAISSMAIRGGWKRTQIEAADMSLYPCVFGYIATGRDLAELEITPRDTKGWSESLDFCDPVDVLYGLHYSLLEMDNEVKSRGKKRSFAADSEKYKKRLSEEVEKSREYYAGVQFAAANLESMLARYLEEEDAVVWITLPSADYVEDDLLFDWKVPLGSRWTDAQASELSAQIEGNKALVFVLRRAEDMKLTGTSVVLRVSAGEEGVRGPSQLDGVYCNRPEEVRDYGIDSSVIQDDVERLQIGERSAPIIPRDYEITDSSKVWYRLVSTGEINSYRMALTNLRRAQGESSYNILVMVDGYAVGIIQLAASGRPGSHKFAFLYATIAAKSRYRLVRLLLMLASSREIIERWKICQNLSLVRVEEVHTVCLSNYPESKSHRIWELVRREIAPVISGRKYLLRYRSDIKFDRAADAIAKWHREEKKYQKSRRNR